MVLTLNLFFIPAMSSIALPFYFLVIAAFACSALMTLGFLVWDKVNLTARLMKQKWQISSLERELEKTKKKLGSDTARAQFLSKNGKADAQPAPVAPAPLRLLPPKNHWFRILTSSTRRFAIRFVALFG